MKQAANELRALGKDQLADRLTDTEASLTTHLGATAAKHNADQIVNTPSGNLAATNVQTALDELQTELITLKNRLRLYED